MTDSAASPLLQGEGLPLFQQISPELVSRDIPLLLQQLDEQFTALEATLQEQLNGSEPLRWDSVMAPMQKLGERLRWSWGVVSHLNGVCNSPELREAHAGQQPEVVRLGNRLGQSKVLHQALCRLRDQPAEPLSPPASASSRLNCCRCRTAVLGSTAKARPPSTKPASAWRPSPPASETTFWMPLSSGR